MVTVPVEVVTEGAVNTPSEVMEPADALHVTELCPDAVKVCDPFNATDTIAGETVIGPPVTTAGVSVIVDVADLVASAKLVAVTVTVVLAATVAGAV
jgi:hypothetical protein